MHALHAWKIRLFKSQVFDLVWSANPWETFKVFN